MATIKSDDGPPRPPTLGELIDALDRAAAVVERVERKMRWNRVGLLALAAVVLLGFVNYRGDRISDCQRTNEARSAIRAAIVGVIDRFTPPDDESIADQVDRYLRDQFPSRDCGGFLP